MTEEPDAPTLFVARDRARRFARYLGDALQERRLHYRGADVGMTSLVDEADIALDAVLKDLATTVNDILDGRIRDRERGYTEMPLVVMAEGLAERVTLARALDRARAAGTLPGKETATQVIRLLDDALMRIDGFCGAYDAKRPMGMARSTDVAHILTVLEREHDGRRRLLDPRASACAPFDRMPPALESEPHGLEDLLRA
ncbi:MAG: hypothetical protein O2894_06375, partial [Planctomycetota bacterium]|nr:hypothetical protein [Planctomycetota bacterium]